MVEPPAGIEPATPSLPWNHQEPLCAPPFPQVAPDRRGRSYRFCFDEVMGSPQCALLANNPFPPAPPETLGPQGIKSSLGWNPTAAMAPASPCNADSVRPNSAASAASARQRCHSDVHHASHSGRCACPSTLPRPEAAPFFRVRFWLDRHRPVNRRCSPAGIPRGSVSGVCGAIGPPGHRSHLPEGWSAARAVE